MFICEHCKLSLEEEGVKLVPERDWLFCKGCVEELKMEHAGFVRHAERSVAKARSQGRQARLDGHLKETNPFKGFALEEAWNAGWMEADADPQAPKEMLVSPETTRDPAPPRGPFDELFRELSDAKLKDAPTAQAVLPEKEDEEQEDEQELLSEAVGRITVALERLAKKGLNMRAVVALLHDANPKLSKKQIKAVLETLRELPAIYGRDLKDKNPLRK